MGLKPNAMKNVVAMAAVSALFLLGFLVCSVSGSVSYDSRAITINGKRRILISGSIHYPRSTPEVCLLISFTISSFVCCNVVRFIPKFESLVPYCLSNIKI